MLNLDFLLFVICRQNFTFTCRDANHFMLITSTSTSKSLVLMKCVTHSLAISIGRVVRIKDPISEKALIYKQALLT